MEEEEEERGVSEGGGVTRIAAGAGAGEGAGGFCAKREVGGRSPS